ncbi:HipA N-terminal domain-containing protein [Bosea lupini]|uniref:HipA N-terminal domain-containing protein n=1 Tax=Bosea lupini TaxID=1036779 RepID=A0A1H7WKT2_9HYPH|nr:HipA N-terminal domain-containing protein [Bosea lupini]
MALRFKRPAAVPSHDVLVHELKVGTIVRTSGDFNAFNFEEAYRATGGFTILSPSFRAAAGRLRKDPQPLARALPAFFANLLPEDKLREAMEQHHAGNVRTAPVLDPGRGRTKAGQLFAYARADRPWDGSDPPTWLRKLS